MKLPAESVYQALFNLICTINAPQANGSPSLTPLYTMSRRFVHWDQVGDIAMPAFYQMQAYSPIRVDQTGKFGLSRYHLKADLYFYFAADSGNLTTPTSPVLNSYFAAVDAVMQPTIQSPGGARQQLGLGPRVEHAWIDGEVQMDEAIFSPPAVLLVPVSIVCG